MKHLCFIISHFSLTFEVMSQKATLILCYCLHLKHIFVLRMFAWVQAQLEQKDVHMEKALLSCEALVNEEYTLRI